MYHTKRSIFKRLYFPGLISLVFLPMMCTGYFLYESKLKKTFGIDIIWADDAMINRSSKLLHEHLNYNTFRKFIKVMLTNDQNRNDFELKILRNEIKKLEINMDTLNGYSVQFTKSMNYENVIKVLDMKTDLRNITFAPYNDEVLIFWMKPETFENRSRRELLPPL